MPPLKTIVTGLLTPLFGLNLAGLGAGALWLVSEGQSQVIWIGFIMLVFSSSIIPILLIPAGIFSHFMVLYTAAQRPDKERIMFFLSFAYIILFLTFWCMGIFEYVTHSIMPHAVAPGVLWASTAAMAPLLWWSSRDKNNVFIMTMVEVTQIAMITLAAARLLLGESSFWLSFGIFGAFLACVAGAQTVYEKKSIDKTGTGAH